LTTATKECVCGEELTGRQSKCSRCYIKEHTGSSQCPFCMEWYWTHRADKSDRKTMELHFGGKCRA
jgi:hypothetical protein